MQSSNDKLYSNFNQKYNAYKHFYKGFLQSRSENLEYEVPKSKNPNSNTQTINNSNTTTTNINNNKSSIL